MTGKLKELLSNFRLSGKSLLEAEFPSAEFVLLIFDLILSPYFNLCRVRSNSPGRSSLLYESSK